MKKLFSMLALFGGAVALQAQDSLQTKPVKEYVYQTFKDTRVINTQSVETLPKRVMDVRIGHRFGDIAGKAGGFQTFFGFENASDISLGVDYGITDRLMVGFHRSKGGGPYRQLLHGLVKYRLLHQTTDNKMPISMAIGGLASVSTQLRDTSNALALSHYPKAAHRFAYALELHFARKFGKVFSLQLSPTFLWRNYVPAGDENYLLNLSMSMHFQLGEMLGLIIDSNFPLTGSRLQEGGNYFSRMALGIGLEIETGAHIFQINITNSTGIFATDYMGYTNANWALGQFRLGFTLSRLFRF